ncbi:MAG: bifunctional YncE family protein/alkaline phosphatase family protein [Saprospiraceae bacterium]
MAQIGKYLYEVPGKDEFCKIDRHGKSVLPSGRYVEPAGKTVSITKGAFGMAVATNDSIAITLHNGVLHIIPLNQPEQNIRIPSYDKKYPSIFEGSSFLGVAIAEDGQTAYLSGGDQGNIIVYDINTKSKKAVINLNGFINGVEYFDSFTSDLCIGKCLNELLVLDRGNNRLVRINLKSYEIIASIPIGRIPFGIAFDEIRKIVLVAHVGLFNYPLIPGVTPTNRDSMMLPFPAYATYSKEAREGVELNDGRKIPGLGSEHSDESMSVWGIDLISNHVKFKIKTGRKIGEFIEDAEIVGGSSPNSIAVGKRYAYISNATNDLISVIDLEKQKLVDEIPIQVHPFLDKFRGIMPFGLALSKNEQKLYVACLGLNAVAVIDTRSKEVKGLIPTGWGTSKVALLKNDKLLTAISIRGYGAGPNGGRDFVIPPQGNYIGDIQLSTLQFVEIPNRQKIKKYTKNVLENTFVKKKIKKNIADTEKLFAGKENPIKHIVYITKENRTFDEVFSQINGVKGDTTLARFGERVKLKGPDSILHELVNVSPNHLKLARTYSVSDNFYCDSDASIHGHHWMVGTIPNEYVEVNSSTSSRILPFSKAPGRRFPKTTGGIDPEDYNEIGGLWENLQRHKISYFNFGECNEFANAYEEWNNTSFGATNAIAYSFPGSLWNNTSRNYAGYNTNIPDQYRVIQFEEEFTKMWLNGKDKMPQFIGIQLPNDHGAGVRPEDGYTHAESFMADNDLALGRIITFLSKTPYWKNMLVIITEDDPQGGVDHIDAHRSILMMVGPYVKRNYVSHKHANFGSILKLIYHQFNLPYVNQYDATASSIEDFFTSEPDFSEYQSVPCDSRIFNPDQALTKYNKFFDWKSVKSETQMDQESEQRKSFYKEK